MRAIVPMRASLTGPLFDGPQYRGCFTFLHGSAFASDLFQHLHQLARETLSRERLRGVLVDDAASRRFERCGDGRCRIRDIVVHERRQALRLMPGDQRVEQEEELMLAFREVADRRKQKRQVVLLLPLHRGGRVFAGRRQIRAVGWAIDLGQSFRATTEGADNLPEGRALPTRFALAAHGAGHVSESHIVPLGAKSRRCIARTHEASYTFGRFKGKFARNRVCTVLS